MKKTLNERFEEAKKDGVEIGFKRLAEYLMNECVLEVNSEEYQLAEIEFYYYDKENHPDVFVHCDEEQLNSNTFYFHGSGMDITFGNDKCYGGILVRSLIKLDNKKPITGPYKIVTDFLHTAKKDENNKLELTIYLKEKKVFNKEPLKSVRVGLTLKETDINKKKLKEEFIFKLYRYILKDESLILDLLKTNEPTFLAWFIKDEEFKDEKLVDRVKLLNKNLKENKQTFLDVKNPTIRQLFIEKFVEK